MEMFSMRVKAKANINSLQQNCAKIQMVREYLSAKIQNEDFGQRVNQVTCSLVYKNVSCFLSENLLSKVNQQCYVSTLTLPV